jgi:hypothetical protein
MAWNHVAVEGNAPDHRNEKSATELILAQEAYFGARKGYSAQEKTLSLRPLPLSHARRDVARSWRRALLAALEAAMTKAGTCASIQSLFANCG